MAPPSAAKARAPAAAGAGAVAAAPPKTLPLSARSLDVFIAFWFVVFAFSTTFTDLHNFIASVKGVAVTELEHMTLPYPPKVLTDVYFMWARSVDPLLYTNPIWWQCIEWVNLIVLTPFAFVAVPAFLAGAGWVRVPAIVVSSFTLYSLILCIGSTLYGDVKSADPTLFLGVYQLYFFFPMLVIARLWSDAPFTRPLSGAASLLLWAFGSITFAVFFSYVAKWLAIHMTAKLPAYVLQALEGAKQLP